MEKIENKQQLLQWVNDANKKAIKVIDSCETNRQISGARRYINLLENRIISLIEELLGVDYFSGSRRMVKNHNLTYTVAKSFQKIQVFYNVKAQQIRSYEKY